jgi:phage terminase small subunit
MAGKPGPRMPRHGVVARRKRFAQAYVASLHPAKAAIAAGFSPNGASARGYRLLTMPDVQAWVAHYAKEHARQMDLTAERTLLEIARCAFLDPRKLFADDGTIRPVSEWDDDTAAAVASLEVTELWDRGVNGQRVKVGKLTKLRFHSKERTLEQLGRHLALFSKADEEGRSISELLKAVLMELQTHPQPLAALEAEWRPMQPGELPPPPSPDERPPPMW